MFGDQYFGETTFAGVPIGPMGPVTTRPNYGGMFGTDTFGQPYFGQQLSAGSSSFVVTTRPNYGGMFGTDTFVQPYFGQELFDGIAPPSPPQPIPVARVRGGDGGGEHRRRQEDALRFRRLRHEEEDRKRRRQNEREEEDLVQMIAVVLNIL